jgi:sporulation protein YlmC with PRC-barrel domain
VGACSAHVAEAFHSSSTEENMTKYLATALLTTALITGAAYAQNKTATTDSAATMHREGEWRASKLVGVNVYNEANEKIGDINDVILDKSGKVENVVLGVGGFLGMGEHYVAVAYDKLKWSNEPPRSTTASTTTSTNNRPVTNVDSNARTAADGTARTTGAATTTADDRKAEGYWYPDHAIYNATKDQLKAMPQFKY